MWPVIYESRKDQSIPPRLVFDNAWHLYVTSRRVIMLTLLRIDGLAECEKRTQDSGVIALVLY